MIECPQTRILNVLLYEFGHLLGLIAIVECVSVTAMVDPFSHHVQNQLDDQLRENSPSPILHLGLGHTPISSLSSTNTSPHYVRRIGELI